MKTAKREQGERVSAILDVFRKAKELLEGGWSHKEVIAHLEPLDVAKGGLEASEKRMVAEGAKELKSLGFSISQIARIIKINPRTLHRWLLPPERRRERRHREFHGEDLALLMDPDIAVCCLAGGVSLQRIFDVKISALRQAAETLRGELASHMARSHRERVEAELRARLVAEAGKKN